MERLKPQAALAARFFGTTAVYLFFFTLQRIPLAGAVTIQYLSPIFTTIIAIFILKERVKPPQWVFYAIAFGGVLLIERFDPRISIIYLLTGVGAAFCSGVAYNLVRSLREREHPLTIVLHFQLFGAVVCFFAMWFDWATPVGWDWFYLLLIGVFSQIGQVFLTHALQKEKAAGVVIINYSGVVYGLIIGWFFFGEAQTLETLSGMLLVVCRRRRLAFFMANAGVNWKNWKTRMIYTLLSFSYHLFRMGFLSSE